MKTALKKGVKRIVKGNWFMTIFATTLGVLLAFYLNNLNDNQTIEKVKNNAIKNLETELSNNERELNDSGDNDSLLVFLSRISDLDSSFSNEIQSTSKNIHAIVEQYPQFIEILDSTVTSTTEKIYDINYTFEFSLPDIHSIAWETSKMNNITNEFNYNCLSSLVQVYKAQELFITEQKKLLTYLINSDYDKLYIAMGINKQIRLQLIEAIKEAKASIKNCG